MKYSVDERGYYGQFGGAFIPEMLYANIEELGYSISISYRAVNSRSNSKNY